MMFQDQTIAIMLNRIAELEAQNEETMALLAIIMSNVIRLDDQVEAIKQYIIPNLGQPRKEALKKKKQPKMRIVEDEKK
jgi:hypothetical protein